MFHVKIIINIISRNHKTLRSCVAPSEHSLKEAHSGFNFQSFPRVDPLSPEKNYYSFSLYCLIQTVSLFKNILGSLSKGEKNYKKK